MGESYEEALQSRVATTGRSDPPETDLDYYARPENYTGTSLNTMRKVMFTRDDKDDKDAGNGVDDMRRDNSVKDICRRYDHVCDDVPEDGVNISDLGNLPLNTSRKPERAHFEAKENDKNAARKISSERLQEKEATEDSIHFSGALGGQKGGIALGLKKNGLDLPPRESVDSGLYLDEDGSVSEGSRRRLVRRSMTYPRMDPDARKKLARERFRKIIRVVLIGLKWILTLKSKEDEDGNSSSKTFTELAEETKYVASDGLTFDVSDFKAKKDEMVAISNEVKAILTMPVQHRTPDHIQTAVYGLQHLQSFAEYPDHMKKKLCQVAWFAQVPPKRVIIRQGHVSENFYFILSGHVLVTILEKSRSGEAKMRTAAVMRKGMSFGELGLLHHSTRTATVQSQDTVQLLQIDRDDFFDIFMSGHRPGEMPDHIKFISQLDFMRGWPTQKLVDNPDYCLFVFFKRGSLIVKDSNNSDWLYIVKSGSCQVLRQLRQYENLPPTADSDEQEDERRTREEALSRAREELKIAMKSFDAAAQRKTETPEGEEAAAPTPGSEAGEQEAIEEPPVDYYQPKGQSRSKYGSYASFKKAHFDTISAPSRRPVTRSAGEEGQKDKQTSKSEEHTSAPIFVQVELLKSKDVFGLNTLQFEDEIEDPKTSVSLVSKGAECIMLSKKFFQQHASYEVKHMLKDLIRPYPSVTTLSENFSTKHNWDEYRRSIMGDVVHNVKRRSVSAVV